MLEWFHFTSKISKFSTFSKYCLLCRTHSPYNSFSYSGLMALVRGRSHNRYYLSMPFNLKAFYFSRWITKFFFFIRFSFLITWLLMILDLPNPVETHTHHRLNLLTTMQWSVRRINDTTGSNRSWVPSWRENMWWTVLLLPAES